MKACAGDPRECPGEIIFLEFTRVDARCRKSKSQVRLLCFRHTCTTPSGNLANVRVNMNDWSKYDACVSNHTVAHLCLAALAGRLFRHGPVDATRSWSHGIRGHLPMRAAAARQQRSIDERDHAELAQKRILDAPGSRVFAMARRTIYLDLHRGLSTSQPARSFYRGHCLLPAHGPYDRCTDDAASQTPRQPHDSVWLCGLLPLVVLVGLPVFVRCDSLAIHRGQRGTIRSELQHHLCLRESRLCCGRHGAVRESCGPLAPNLLAFGRSWCGIHV